jgi:hypothetical protein
MGPNPEPRGEELPLQEQLGEAVEADLGGRGAAVQPWRCGRMSGSRSSVATSTGAALP